MYDYIQDKSEYGTRQEIIYNVILMGEITIIHDQRMHKTRKKISRKLIKSYLIWIIDQMVRMYIHISGWLGVDLSARRARKSSGHEPG